jgi:hypothetical protein
VRSRRLAAALALPLALVLSGGAASAQAPGPVLVVGDSLEVGTGPRLKRELSGVDVTVDARKGRPSPEGVGVLRAMIRPAHRVIVFDLGTNDDPSQPGRLRTSLAAARELAGGRCLVVATLVRPPLNGVGIGAMNDVVERFASTTSTVRLADWRATASGSRELISRDGVHATPDGYAARARLVADAVRSCSDEPGTREPPASGARRPGATPEPQRRIPRIAPQEGLDELVASLPRELGLTLLRGAAGLVEAAVQQAQGAVVPIVPDPVLGRPDDPLGKRSR